MGRVEDYIATKDTHPHDQRDQWIVDHEPLVRQIVRRTCRNSSADDVDDLVSAGMLGLVRAARRYDPSREAQFKTYATLCIRGAVMNEIRRRSFVPRGVHHQLRRLRYASDRHAATHGEPPDEVALAIESGLTPKQIRRLLSQVRPHMFSVGGQADSDDHDTGPQPATEDQSPHDLAERRELLHELNEALEDLSARERFVLLLYYERELSAKEVAQTLRISLSRVSQLHGEIIAKLTRRMSRRLAA